MIKFAMKNGCCVVALLITQVAIADHNNNDRRGRFVNPQRSESFSTHNRQSTGYQDRDTQRWDRPGSPSNKHYSHHEHNYYRPGYSTRYLPHGHSRVFAVDEDYFFYDGYFYRPYQDKFRLTEAPIGAIILNLPRLHFYFRSGGIDFFRVGNTYYRRHPRGYIVVRNPEFRGEWR